MSRTTRTRLVTVTAIAAAATFTLTACGGGSGNAEGDGTLRIGVVGASDDKWAVFQEQAEAEGLTIELVDLQDYTQANPSLSQGELDANQFQHLQFLAGYNVDADDDLTPIGATAVYPLGLYSEKHDSLEQIPAGGEVAVPNDPTNLARALLVLQDAGLIELKDGGSAVSTEADVLPSSKVTVTPVAAEQTPIQLKSVDASIVNNDFLADSGLDPDSALFQDDPDSKAAEPYINVWVARAEDSDDPDLKKLVEISHSDEVVAAEKKQSGGTAVIKDNSPEELQEILSGLEDDIRSAS
ncbi:MetQ/NlpA family ABC transporter substrate-binding protein [Krasilnikoviella flava]|uniref:D-methionine transport system substrate-binding protein n=1 Tax=Krasilnikoviella flava TaxID=526729 RepID=A0A1T5IPI7_9MICO|nr:MetQ/NlpA family ABC transporter substrate-binding protein [Krasilnikoviella flava]SKC41035.1 D-methionine transport system substrate-binding protein [Krasilnikoviella flava]